MLRTLPIESFVDETASSSPAPGGGSVSALAASLGAALTSMVCRLTIGKKKYADVQAEMESVLSRSEEIRGAAMRIIDEDTEAFNAVMKAYGLPKRTETEIRARTAAIEAATRQATLVPLKLMQLAFDALALAAAAAEKGNVNSISDAGVASLMLEAACAGALLNVEINLRSISDVPFVEATRASAQQINDQAAAKASAIAAKVRQRLAVS